MLKKVDIGLGPHHEVFGNPAPMGLFCLAIATSALIPMLLGYLGPDTPSTLLYAAAFALLFGACGQLLTGLMDFANKNGFGGAVFTTFSFMWGKNAVAFYMMAKGLKPDPYIDLATDIVIFVILAVLTYGFGFFSKLLFAFLLDIDLLFVCKLGKHLLHYSFWDTGVIVFSIGMGLLAMWMGFGALINPVAGRELFPMTGPLFYAPRRERFDWTTRNSIFTVLYKQWRKSAFDELTLAQLNVHLQPRLKNRNIVPDLFYLWELNFVHLTFENSESRKIISIRLTAAGIDLYEQLILQKYQWT